MSGGTANRRRGLVAERHLVTWLRTQGWPHAERSVVTGYRTAHRERRDGGDITGTPGIVWSLKDCAKLQIPAWWAELHTFDGPDRFRLLVVKNRGHASPAEWWCWLRVADMVELASTQLHPCQDLIRCHLSTVVSLLREAGYGQAPVSA